MTTSKLPPNIEEFNIIAGLVLAQLYKALPVRLDMIDRAVIAEAMNVPDVHWGTRKLPSGRSFKVVLDSTIFWLVDEGFVRSADNARGADCATLTVKGLAALNAVPDGLGRSVGTALTDAADKGWRSGLGSIGELMGGIIGGAAKSMASG